MSTRDEERWSPEDEAEARYDAKHNWPNADDASDRARESLLNWLDNIEKER